MCQPLTLMALRNVTSFVPRTVKSILTRLIGGLDIRGNGVDHPLLGLDPFVLCDAAPEIPGIGDNCQDVMPRGLCACTLTQPWHCASTLQAAHHSDSTRTTAWLQSLTCSMDLLTTKTTYLHPERPRSDISTWKGLSVRSTVFYVTPHLIPWHTIPTIPGMASSGQGMCHSEKSASEGNNGVMQTIVRIPHSKLHLPPAIRRAHPSDIPRISIEGMHPASSVTMHCFQNIFVFLMSSIVYC